MMPKKTRAVVGYILAGMAMLVLFLYLRFPEKIVKDFIESAASARCPGIRLSLGTTRPAIPPGLRLEPVEAVFPAHPGETLRADRLTVRPAWPPLFRGRFAFLAEAESYGGRIRGRIDFQNILAVKGPFTATADFGDIRLEKCAWLRETLARQAAGTLKGSAYFNHAGESLQNGTGNLMFTLTNVNWPLTEPLFGFSRLDFSRVEATIGFRNGSLKITELFLDGNRLKIALKGDVILSDNLPESRIDLNGTLEMPGQGNRRVKVAIGGTLRSPQTRFM